MSLTQSTLPPKKVKIGPKHVGDKEPCFVIAEIGINHNGDLNFAKKLIDVGAQSGADAVKFQKRTVDVVYTPEELARPRENPFGPTNGDLKRGLEFGYDEYREIDRYCKEKNILWLTSCWDEKSVDFMEQFNPPCYKIASASLTDAGLLKHTCATKKPLIISTGMSTLDEIRKAVDLVHSFLGENFVLLHCVSTYPAENHELNLLGILKLRELFKVLVGYSGHEKGIAPSVMAAVLGACVIERHITLDRAMWGTDQAASLEPPGFGRLIRDIRVWEEAKGTGEKVVLPSEVPILKKLRRVDTL